MLQIIVLALYTIDAVYGRQYADKVLLISMDGFRWDYIQKANTPNFDRFAQHGVKAASFINNTFITKTFPCHYSIATGKFVFLYFHCIIIILLKIFLSIS